LAGTVAFGYVLSVLGVKGSLRYASVMATLEIAVVVFIGLWLIISRPSINTVSVFSPSHATGGISGVLLGVLFMYTAFFLALEHQLLLVRKRGKPSRQSVKV
jgi:amino acid transporter